jgi:glycosyltransferase involved in cell wall biosynthesis
MYARIKRKILRERDFVSEFIRERMELLEEARLLDMIRKGNRTCWEADDEPEPLVTVRIATYNIGPVIAERALASIIRQSYNRLQILVIGDHCDDLTAKAVQSVDDDRICFINLPVRGMYPQYRAHSRKVAGSHPMNVALALAKGKWIAPCDDDDEFTPDHVESLLKSARTRSLEMVYSKALCEVQPGKWEERGSEPLVCGGLTHGSVLYAAGLRFMRHSNTSWKLHGEPSDWNLWKRMKLIGVRIGFLDHLTYQHYLGAYQREKRELDDRNRIPNVLNQFSSSDQIL